MKLFSRDEDADHGGVDDMTKLTYLNEPGVVDNLERRYTLNEIYVSELLIYLLCLDLHYDATRFY